MDSKEDERWDESKMALLAPILDKAKTCERFREGAPATLDVDREGIPYEAEKVAALTPADLIAAGYTDDPEAAQLLFDREVPRA
jgi:hypothetical protein